MAALGPIVSASTDGKNLLLKTPHGVVQLNRFWLRDNAPLEGDRAGLFRELSIDDLPTDLAITGVELVDARVQISFSDGFQDWFDGRWLVKEAALNNGSSSSPASAIRERPALPRFSFADLVHGSADHHRFLEAVCTDGAALVTEMPEASTGTEGLAALIGPIRETDFGRIFEIVTEPKPFTPSQSASALDPHTDDPYRYTPSGISALHCVTPSEGSGGASIVVDGFAIADHLRTNVPGAFDVLSTVPVPFVHERTASVEQGSAVHLRAEAPIIAVDRSGAISGIRFHERSMGVLRLDPDLAERVYLAVKLFANAVRSPEWCLEYHLEAGEALVYDNQRMLHGRTGFSGAQTRRHLRLFTVDRSLAHSQLRLLRARFAPDTAEDRLPAGNLS